MVGTTLTEIRQRVETLASPDGDYYLVCGRTGERPVPADHLRFTDRERAREAARATEQYRAALRRYDPRLPYYDLIACQDHAVERTDESPGSAVDAAGPWTLSEPVLDGGSPDATRADAIDFCHRVAAAVFETLSDADYDGVERAVMDAYVDHAETVTDPDELCLTLLESMATELGDRLAPREQAAVLARAAEKLPRSARGPKPVAAALASLRDSGIVGEFECAPTSIDRNAAVRTVVVELSEYALSPLDGALPTLPIALELFGREPAWQPAAIDVAEAADGWRLSIELARDAEPDELTRVPIRG